MASTFRPGHVGEYTVTIKAASALQIASLPSSGPTPAPDPAPSPPSPPEPPPPAGGGEGMRELFGEVEFLKGGGGGGRAGVKELCTAEVVGERSGMSPLSWRLREHVRQSSYLAVLSLVVDSMTSVMTSGRADRPCMLAAGARPLLLGLLVRAMPSIHPAACCDVQEADAVEQGRGRAGQPRPRQPRWRQVAGCLGLFRYLHALSM